jgi:hypothetical protein
LGRWWWWWWWSAMTSYFWYGCNGGLNGGYFAGLEASGSRPCSQISQILSLATSQWQWKKCLGDAGDDPEIKHGNTVILKWNVAYRFRLIFKFIYWLL